MVQGVGLSGEVVTMTFFQWYIVGCTVLLVASIWWVYGPGGAYSYANSVGDYIGKALAPYVALSPVALIVAGFIIKGIGMLMFG